MGPRNTELDTKARADDLPIAMYLSDDSVIVDQIVQSKRFVPNFRGFQSQRKRYKDRTLFPNETVSWSITVLRNLFRNSPFKVVHLPSLNTPPSTWFAQGNVYRTYHSYFQVGGKGLTLEESMASLYGEMLERIQTRFFFSRNPYRPRICFHYESETSDVVTKEMRELNRDFYSMMNRNSVSQQDTPNSIRASPVYESYRDMASDDTAWISTGLICSTTGLAGGNTYEEAFIQAFCEVLERYCSFVVLRDQIGLPTIPETKYSLQTRELLRDMDELGYQVIIKDASLDFNVPVVAALFVSKDKEPEEKRAAVTFGAATSLDVAIERCVTECLQWVDNLGARDRYNSLYVEQVHGLYETFPELEGFLSKHGYFVESYARRNCFPSESLAFLMENTGRPEIKEFASSDVKEEVDYVLQLARSRGFHVYMKDRNWLGFPVVMVFIPELNIGRRLRLPSDIVQKFKDRLLADPSSITMDDLRILEDPEFILNIQARDSLSEFFEIDTLTLERWNTWEFFGLLALAFGLTGLASKYLRQKYHDVPDPGAARTDSMLSHEILQELALALPDCRKPCIECRFIKECKFTILGEFESTLLNSYPDRFCGTEPGFQDN